MNQLNLNNQYVKLKNLHHWPLAPDVCHHSAHMLGGAPARSQMISSPRIHDPRAVVVVGSGRIATTLMWWPVVGVEAFPAVLGHVTLGATQLASWPPAALD